MQQYPYPVDRVQIGLFDAGENPVSYGADMTGNRDSTAAINQAIATATQPSGSGSVSFPFGIFIVSGPLIVPAGTNVTIQGKGQGRTIIRAAPGYSSGAVLDIFANATIVRDLTVDGGNGAAYGVYLDDNEVSGGSYQCQLINIAVINVTGTPGWGIANNDHAYSLIIERCLVRNCNVSLVLQNHAQNLNATDTVFEYPLGGTVNSQTVGNVYLKGLSGASFRGCDFEIPSPNTNTLINVCLVGCRPVAIDDCYIGVTGTGSQEIVIGGTTSTNNNVSIRDLVVDAESTASAIVTILATVTGCWLTCHDWYSNASANVASVSDGTNAATIMMANLQGTGLASADTLGSGSPDLYGAAGPLKTANVGAILTGHSSGINQLQIRVDGDTQPRFAVSSSQLGWGAGGASAQDAFLFRRSAGVLASTTSTDIQAGRRLIASNFGAYQASTFYMGSGAPAGASGAIGDVYFNTSGTGSGGANNIYIKTGSSTWTNIV